MNHFEEENKELFVIRKGILIAYNGHDKSVTIPAGVKSIGGDAFGKEIEERLGKVIPRSLRGDAGSMKAFYGNEEIEEIIIPEGVREIGFKAFEGCVNLKHLVLPGSLSSIGCNAFMNCHIELVEFGGTIRSLDKKGFRHSFPRADQLVCKDGTLTFHTQSPYYISDYFYQGSMEEWKNLMAAHWLTRRAERIHCTDGILTGGPKLQSELIRLKNETISKRKTARKTGKPIDSNPLFQRYACGQDNRLDIQNITMMIGTSLEGYVYDYSTEQHENLKQLIELLQDIEHDPEYYRPL